MDNEMREPPITKNTLVITPAHDIGEHRNRGDDHERDEEAFAIYIFQIVALL
jgi:hypothetical protein